MRPSRRPIRPAGQLRRCPQRLLRSTRSGRGEPGGGCSTALWSSQRRSFRVARVVAAAPVKTATVPATCHSGWCPTIGLQSPTHAIGSMWTRSELCRNHKIPTPLSASPTAARLFLENHSATATLGFLAPAHANVPAPVKLTPHWPDALLGTYSPSSRFLPSVRSDSALGSGRSRFEFEVLDVGQGTELVRVQLSARSPALFDRVEPVTVGEGWLR